MSKENVVADSWEDADADPVKELMEKVEKVKLLQRKEEKKEAFFEKVKAEENGSSIPKLQAEDGLGPAADEPKRVFLRRPKDGFTAENDIEPSPPSAASPENQPTARSRSHHKSNQKDHKQPTQTYEERQAAYQAARNRILGTEYKPDNQEIKEIKFIDRSKSPETLKMTQQNMVEHYGEELSRELMQQPVENVMTPQMQFVPDFSLPPPFMGHPDGCGVYNGPQGFQMMPPNVPQPYQQHHFIENPYYMQINGQVPVPFINQGQMPHFIPQDPSAASSTSQNYIDNMTYYYCQPTQQQMNCAQNLPKHGNLPNMAYPPPNLAFPPHAQQNPQMMNPMSSPQVLPMRSMTGHLPNQFQTQNSIGHGSSASTHGFPQNGGGRGLNKQHMMYQGNGAPSTKPPPLMANIQDKNSVRNSGNGRQYHHQQSGQFNQYQHSNQNNMGNGKKHTNKNAKLGQKGIDNHVNKTNYNYSQLPVPVPNNHNPIPFGCPPLHANAIREQQANKMPPNTGDGLLGAHPMMVTSQWPSLPGNKNN